MKISYWIFRLLYKLIDWFDREKQVLFMNYGYSQSEDTIKLDSENEKNRYPIQLYRHLTEMADISGKKVVEVGCGRGGGLAHLANLELTSEFIGIDIEKSAVKFANNRFRKDNLSYIVGNAEKIPLSDNSCNLVLNVESSHRYESIESFLAEVKRILSPGGIFLFTDFRFPHEWSDFLEKARITGLELLHGRDITLNVLSALEKDNDRRIDLIRRYSPRILHKQLMDFSGCVGSETYNRFSNRSFTYYSYMFRIEE